MQVVLISMPAFVFAQHIVTGANQTNLYFHLLKSKKVGVVVNQTSRIGSIHLVDSMVSAGIQIKRIFAPEHGFRGDHSAGEKVSNSTDGKTGLPIVSLYGKNKKPLPEQIADLDLLIFDIQDVGARFYTYISTLHYVMEACAEQKKKLLILDRPNPNGYYVDGPVLDMRFKSFVGMHPVPIVHGLTIGEYARMINGEKWLDKGIQCNIVIVSMVNYTHDSMYQLPVRPSPNLPTPESIALYPSLCLFEGTNYSIGRGTNKPFECVGKPGISKGDYYFTPRSIKGVADNPLQEGKNCRGFLLTDFANHFVKKSGKIYLSILIDLYKTDTAKATFFNNFFDNLAGTDELRKSIEQNQSEQEIRNRWKPGLEAYRKVRKKYLLYPDFSFIIYDKN